jgi:hypothetical protein
MEIKKSTKIYITIKGYFYKNMEENTKLLTVSVISKIPCFFEIEISEKESTKLGRQGQRQVLASNVVREEVKKLLAEGDVPIATGKMDGICTLIYKGEDGSATIGMRRDLRISKNGQYVSKKGKPSSPPKGWFSLVEKPDHEIVKGKWTHHVGFRPANHIEDKWAFDAVEDCKARVLISISPIKFEMIPLKQLMGKTCELMGPKVRNNPHGFAVHCFAVHGSFAVDVDSTNINSIKTYLIEDPIGKLFEGIVWHFAKAQKCFKVHRDHLGIKWEH